MARKRMEGTALQTWDEADQALKGIGICDLSMENIEGRMNIEIMEIKAAAADSVQPLKEKKAALELALKEFTTLHRSEIKGKTRKLVFGSLGFRLSSKVIIAKGTMKAVVAKVLELKLNDCLKVKMSLKKDELKKLDEETLTKVGAVLKTVDAFGYDIDREKITEGVAA